MHNDQNHHQAAASARRKLAENLINSVGRSGAIHACYENLWYGALDVILEQTATNWSRPVQILPGMAPRRSEPG